MIEITLTCGELNETKSFDDSNPDSLIPMVESEFSEFFQKKDQNKSVKVSIHFSNPTPMERMVQTIDNLKLMIADAYSPSPTAINPMTKDSLPLAGL